MKVDVITVFDKATYVSGEVVSGRIRIIVKENITLESILLRFLGESRVFWTEKSHTYLVFCTIKVTTPYSNNEIFIDNTTILQGGANVRFELGIGEYDFPFSLQLPPILPSSFIRRIGGILYSANVIFVRSKKKEVTYSSFFDVISNTDLNSAAAQLMNSVTKSDEKYLCCCCCRSGPITMVVTLPFQGLAIGQTCEAVVEIDNVTKNVVTGKICLYQVVMYKAKYKSDLKVKTDENRIVEQTFGEVGGGDSKTFTTSLIIPIVPVSHLQISEAITISYYLKFKGVVSGIHSDASVEVPIAIGNIPLLNTVQ